MAEGLIAKFYLDAVENKAKSREEGRPIFEDVEHIKIIPIGDKNTIITKRATKELRQRFAAEYAVFKDGVEQTFSGTPLAEWPAMTPSQIKMFNHHNIYTVEHLAEVDDIHMNKIGPGTRKLVEKAKAYLSKAKNTAEAQKYAEENEELRGKIERQDSTIAELSRRLDEMSDDKSDDKPKRGRPPKQEQAVA